MDSISLRDKCFIQKSSLHTVFSRVIRTFPNANINWGKLYFTIISALLLDFFHKPFYNKYTNRLCVYHYTQSICECQAYTTIIHNSFVISKLRLEA